jgi:hypothetical protein
MDVKEQNKKRCQEEYKKYLLDDQNLSRNILQVT